MRYCGDIVTSLSGAVLITESDRSLRACGLICLDPHQAETVSLWEPLTEFCRRGQEVGPAPPERMGQGQGRAFLWRVESCDLCVECDWLHYSLPCDTAQDTPQKCCLEFASAVLLNVTLNKYLFISARDLMKQEKDYKYMSVF